MIRKVVLLTVLVLFIFSAAEFAMRLYLSRTDRIQGIIQWRESRPLPWQHSPYWSRGFADLYSAIHWHLTDAGYWLPDDFHSQYVNYENSVRRTVGQPLVYTNTVYIFGSSILFNNEVPDALTLPSQLQALFNANHLPYRVVNLGSAGANVAQHLERLKTLPLRPGDRIVYFAGVLEPYSIYTSAQNEWYAHRPGLCQTYGALALVEYVCTLHGSPPDLADPTWLDGHISAMERDYTRNLEQSKIYANAHGAQFLMVLQPYIWMRPLSSYESDMLAREYIARPGLETLMYQTWPEMQRLTVGLDLSHGLDNAHDIYLDEMHWTERGNALLALQLFQSFIDEAI